LGGVADLFYARIQEPCREQQKRRCIRSTVRSTTCRFVSVRGHVTAHVTLWLPVAAHFAAQELTSESQTGLASSKDRAGGAPSGVTRQPFGELDSLVWCRGDPGLLGDAVSAERDVPGLADPTTARVPDTPHQGDQSPPGV
jgi:hypothetical protein